MLRIEQACRDPLNKLIHELEGCRRYYEATFPNKPVDRLVFVGGEAKHRNLCQHIAREMGLAAQVGDPMVRLSKVAEIPPDAGIDPTQPQPSRCRLRSRAPGSRPPESAIAVSTGSPYGAPRRIRTCDHRIRSPVLYPAELGAREGLT